MEATTRTGHAAGMWMQLFEHCRQVGGPVHVHVAAKIASLAPSTIRARARREGWWQPYRDVIAPPGTPQTPTTWALAALARAHGPDPKDRLPAALTRWSGAALYGLHKYWPKQVQVAVPLTRAPIAGPRLEVVRCKTFDPEAVQVRDDVTVVDAPVLIRHLAAVATVDALMDIVIDAVQQRLTTLEAVEAEYQRHPRFPGRRRMAEALARLGAAGRTDSRPELVMRERLLAAGVPLDPGQVAVPCLDGVTIHLDSGIKRIFFGVDVHSMLGHATRQQMLVDIRRGNQLVRVHDDWRVLRASWEDLREGWPAFLDLVVEVVAFQSQRHLGLPWPPALPEPA